MNVATLNIWNRFGPWEERLIAIRTRLAELAPDVIGLQEVVRAEAGGVVDQAVDQAALIAQGLGYEIAWGLASQAHGPPVGNAILSRWPIRRQVVFPLPTEGTEERRSMLLAEIDAPFATVPFFVTHLNWKLHHGHVRQKQVRFVADTILREAQAGGFPPIVVGDFNAEPESDEIRFMRGFTALGGESVYFADCFAAAGDGSKGTTFARRNPFAALCHEPDRRIDYVFVRGPDERYRGEPLSARVCFDEAVGGVYPSDHFGVVATISTGARTVA